MHQNGKKTPLSLIEYILQRKKSTENLFKIGPFLELPISVRSKHHTEMAVDAEQSRNSC